MAVMTDIQCNMIPAAAEDLEEIHALARKAAACSKVTDWDDEYPNLEIFAEDLQGGGLHKAVHHGRIIAVIHIGSWADHLIREGEEDMDSWKSDFHNPCVLSRFCVDPDLQGRGLGRRMMGAAIECARTLGYDGIRFHASKSNPLVLHLYDSMGFRRTGEASFPYGDFICYEMQL